MKLNRMAILLGTAALIALPPRSLADSQEPIDLIPVTATQIEAVSDPRPVIVTEHVLNEMNRAAHGEPFGSSVQDCINSHEFAFFDPHAHRSEENLRIVREAMNEWYSLQDGNNPGVAIPRCAFYISFKGLDNRQLGLLDIYRNPIEWDPVK